MLVPLAEWARREIEEQADEILAKDRRSYKPGHSTHYFGILSEDQLQLRNQREMLTKTGRFEVLNPGIYHRAWNPLADTRPSRRRQYSLYADPWRQFSYESAGSTGGNFQAWNPSVLREEVTSGMYFDTWFVRDPVGVTPAGQNYHYHLTIQQRCRIRSIMKSIPVNKPLVREALKDQLGRHYGIPRWVVTRCVVNNHNNDVQ